jgi:hypothetical protein
VLGSVPGLWAWQQLLALVPAKAERTNTWPWEDYTRSHFPRLGLLFHPALRLLPVLALPPPALGLLGRGGGRGCFSADLHSCPLPAEVLAGWAGYAYVLRALQPLFPLIWQWRQIGSIDYPRPHHLICPRCCGWVSISEGSL